MPEKLFFNGDIFGIVDNGILVAVTLYGIFKDQQQGGKGIVGGCMYVAVLTYVWLKLFKKEL